MVSRSHIIRGASAVPLEETLMFVVMLDIRASHRGLWPRCFINLSAEGKQTFASNDRLRSTSTIAMPLTS